MHASPPEITNPSQEVATEGRQVKSMLALLRFGVVVFLIVLVAMDYRYRGVRPTWVKFRGSPEFKGLVGVAVVYLVMWVIRRGGTRQFARRTPSDPPAVGTPGAEQGPTAQEKPVPTTDGQSGRPSGTIVCCSGGGIKSASFCLGALGRLDAKKGLEDVSALVGVSGGGYAASAYLAMYQHLDAGGLMPEPGRTPFEPGSVELTELRRRTNIVTSPGRARFDLVTSLLFGIGVNVVLLSAGIVALAWLVAQHVVLVKMVDTTIRTDSSLWGLRWSGWEDWWLQLLGPLTLLVIAVLIFCFRRLGEYVTARKEDGFAVGAKAAKLFRAAIVVSRPVVATWQGEQRGARLVWSWLVSPVALQDALRRNFLGQMPNRLLQVAVPLAAVTVGLPWVAVQLHNAMIDGRAAGFSMPVETTAALGIVGGLIGSLRSLFKGVTTPLGSETPTGRAMELVRRRIAPFVAVSLFVLILFVVTAATTAAYITAASRGKLGYGPLIFAVVVPVALWAFGLTNLTTIHPYYRQRLSFAFLEHSGAGDLRLAELDPDWNPPHEASATPPIKRSARKGRGPEETLPAVPGYVRRAEAGGSGQEPPGRPNLVLMATANIAEGDVLPSGRGGTPFVLGADCLGLSEPTLPKGACWVHTADYRTDPSGPARLLHLSKAMAISGAAFAPRAGRESKLVGVYRLLLAFANLRLGVWMPNPYYPNSRAGQPGRRFCWWLNELLDRPTSLAVLAEAFGSMPVSAPFLYLTDGGHYDNLGLVEALRRRPARVIVLDGSGDDEDKFPVVGDAVATVRMDHGIEVEFDPARLLRGTDRYPRAAHARAVARYPARSGRPAGTCDITYIKCVMPAGLPWDLEAYRLRNPDFPATTQRFEMFDEFDFEAYRKLGECLVDRAFEAGAL